MTRIGVVGLGAMGGRIADRLRSQGHDVCGTNRTKSKAHPLIERGLVWCDSPREVAQAAEVVISMVTDSHALEAVTEGPDGIIAGLSPAKIYIDMSTVSPRASRELAERVAAGGAAMLAAPVSGSLPAAEQGTLAIIAGGNAEAFERVEPILRQLGATVSFVGTNDHALLLKLAINISLAVQMLAFSEGVLLAERGGIERKLALDVLTSSAIGSPMLQARAPLVLDLPQEAWFDILLMHKDIGLVLETGDELHVALPTTSVAEVMLNTALERGYGQRDIAALFDVLAQTAPDEAQREQTSQTA